MYSAETLTILNNMIILFCLCWGFMALSTQKKAADLAPPGRQHSFVEFDHEIFSRVILPLIQEGQLSVSGKRMCTILVNDIED